MLSHRHRSCGILCLCDVKDGKLIIEENSTNMVNIKVIDSTWEPQIGEYKKSIIVYSDNWNDYGYYTLFHMVYFDEQGFIKQIGSLKIYSKALDEPDNDICFVRTLLPDTIKILNSKFCSLGCDLNYYRNLKTTFPNEYMEILNRLKDISTNNDVYEVFKDDIGVQKSLLRESSAEKALYEAKYVLKNNKLEEKDISFKCYYKAPYSLNAIELSFNFKKNQYIPYRICAIVGKNGTGKTQFLSQLASSLSGLNKSDDNIIFKDKRPPIDRVMSISYSVFDGFNKVRGEESVYSYVYCGLQTENGILSQNQIQQNFKMAYSEIINRGRFNDWENIIKEVLESEHQDILKQIEAEDFNDINWSSGQHILISTMTELVCNIEKESLILFDEPEIHLHPNAIANVMRMFSKLLEKYDSYAIFATHSPIILQELPSTNIQIFEKIDNTFFVRNPLIECFGDNISNIISDVFDVTEIESYHKQVLKKLSDQIPEEEVYNLFNEHLSMDARIYLKTLYRGIHND